MNVPCLYLFLWRVSHVRLKSIFEQHVAENTHLLDNHIQHVKIFTQDDNSPEETNKYTNTCSSITTIQLNCFEKHFSGLLFILFVLSILLELNVMFAWYIYIYTLCLTIYIYFVWVIFGCGSLKFGQVTIEIVQYLANVSRDAWGSSKRNLETAATD